MKNAVLLLVFAAAAVAAGLFLLNDDGRQARGTETLPKVVGGGILQLHRHPEQRADLIADPALIPTAFAEIARYEMPTQFLTRTVARDHELRGQKLRVGNGIVGFFLQLIGDGIAAERRGNQANVVVVAAAR